jgi:hypothetical protein
MFCFLILILVLLGERRKPRSDLAALCLIFAFLRHFTVDFVWGDGWAYRKTSFRLPLTFLDFCVFLLWYCLILSVAKGENLVKTRLDFA